VSIGFFVKMSKICKISPDEIKYLQIINQCLAKPIKSLWYIGKLPESPATSVAIVGTRKPTPYGQEMTYKLSYELASRGIVVVSGLALGVDGVAHKAALDAGGITIAVLPTSLANIHPKTHHELAKRIIQQGGALITEYSPEDYIHKGNFLARNRIVSALSDGILITEAASRSGTLATAAFALEQGKSVMAVPGNATSPASSGCNKLLKQGAKVATDAQDVLEELGITQQPTQTELLLPQTPEEAIIIKLIQQGMRDGNEIHQNSKLSAADFSQTITLLEIEGKVRALGANQWVLK
jgi:DNA processing protein